MNTKLIGGLIVAGILFVGWSLYKYWETFQDQKAAEEKAIAARTVKPDQLPGMPYELQGSLELARRQGPKAMQQWLKSNARILQDPRKAWLELDLCGMMYRSDPQEAKRIFQEVQSRTPQNSPVWHRVQEMRNTYE